MPLIIDLSFIKLLFYKISPVRCRDWSLVTHKKVTHCLTCRESRRSSAANTQASPKVSMRVLRRAHLLAQTNISNTRKKIFIKTKQSKFIYHRKKINSVHPVTGYMIFRNSVIATLLKIDIIYILSGINCRPTLQTKLTIT